MGQKAESVTPSPAARVQHGGKEGKTLSCVILQAAEDHRGPGREADFGGNKLEE